MAATNGQQIANWPVAEVHVLDEAKAKRLGGKTMLMPSPVQIAEYVSTIPFGETRTLKQARIDLARQSGADITCPVGAKLCWRLLAEAVEAGDVESHSWWRLTLDNKPNPRTPGGVERHRSLALAEGISLP